MKILFITHTVEFYGANHSLFNLLKGLQEKGVECTVIVQKKGQLTEKLSANSIEYAVFPFEWSMQYRWYSRNPIKAYWQKQQYRKEGHQILAKNQDVLQEMVQYAQAFEPNLVHSNSSVIDIGYHLSQIVGIPHVWHIREYGTLHYGLYPINEQSFIEQLNNTQQNICISKGLINHLAQKGITQNVALVYNPIYTQQAFETKQQLASSRIIFSESSIVFVLVGIISPNKGQEEAIRALAVVCRHSPNTQLWLVGGGKIEHLKALSEDLGIADNVHFKGKVSDVSPLYVQVDAVLMCSKSEGFGRVTVEAMAHLRPVIGFDSAGTAEIIREGENGLLYRNGHKELAQKMIQLIEQPLLAQTLAKTAYQEAKQKYNTESHVQQVYQIYQRLIG